MDERGEAIHHREYAVTRVERNTYSEELVTKRAGDDGSNQRKSEEVRKKTQATGSKHREHYEIGIKEWRVTRDVKHILWGWIGRRNNKS